ncbi:bifunctional DNA-formamidopyrimidine glycosylase/DNA-(apurinic or apyrimidinic site) lyase [Sporichthya brevicatena]|uniref:Formamidopyrimidine-DNA glycosylase n=1 Tax=Sporichthya brevicatena TaxID=171442 RepID=A0ABP3SET4_9ACTN
MPELPEVEVVRRGTANFAVGRTIVAVEVLHPRAVRRHAAGGADLAARLTSVTVTGAERRGKFLWLPLDSGEALLVHLGMSGQLRVQPPTAPPEKHLRVRLAFADHGPDLRFVDQRTFGGLSVEPLVLGRGDRTVPASVAHIALDPLEPEFDAAAVRTAMRAKRTGLKRALLDQTLVSGIGNIYADEALWRAQLHYARPTETLRATEIDRVLAAATAVMTAALAAGGTSFDSLYVNVNGESGYFDRSLDVYGREGRECGRCGSAIRRDAFMNRSSFSCPRCQPRPRRAHW